MEKLTYFPCLLSFTISLVLIVTPVKSQSNTICTGAMIRSFTPCISYLTSGSNASSPTSDCCNSLKNLMSNGQDCLCLMITGGVPFQVPLNQTLAMSLPRACRTSGVPVECKATASPVPAPDPQNPGGGGTSMSPPSPKAPLNPQFSPPSLAPEGDTIPTLTPPGMRPTLTSSATHSSHAVFPSLMAVLGVIILFKSYILICLETL